MAWRIFVVALPLSCGFEVEVHIGSSYGYKTKCVPTKGPVHCPSHVSNIGQYPDTFHIFQRRGEVCARRTDYEGDWSIHLKVTCQRMSPPSGGYQDHVGHGIGGHHGYPAGGRKVTIGTSSEPVKCVADPGDVQCDSTAKELGRTGKWPDTFHIYHHGHEICARRTDAIAGWGLELILECRSTHGYAHHGYSHHYPHSHRYPHQEHLESTRVHIGSSLENSVKCVTDPGQVHCDDTAEQIGRTGQYPDTFHIYHDGSQICARRTDADAGWGLDLVLDCHRGVGGAASAPNFYLSAKVRWCCVKQPFSRACPYDCQAGMHSSEQTWTEHKRGWCCRNRGLGCPVGSQPPAPSARGSSHSYDCDVADPISEVVYNGPVQHSEQKRYDCHHGSREMWSQEKAQYCRLWLAVKGVQYEYTGDCHGDRSDWSPEKIRRCEHWSHSGAPHECREGSAETWTQEKFTFCCVIKGIGCPQEEPLRFVRLKRQSLSGRNDWEDEFSQDVLDKGAELPRPGGQSTALHFNCAHSKVSEWSATKTRWCCEKWGLGCQALGSFNCSEGFWNWRKGWSGEKKAYCCTQEKKGCESAPVKVVSIKAPPVQREARHEMHSPHHRGHYEVHHEMHHPHHGHYARHEMHSPHHRGHYEVHHEMHHPHHGHYVHHEIHHPSHHGHYVEPPRHHHSGDSSNQAWYEKDNVMNLHIGESPNAGTKCVTPSDAVSCPVNAGNVGRADEYPDEFRIFRKGGQVCAERTDYKELWGLDLVLKCIKLDDQRFKKVHIGSSDSSLKCVHQPSPVSCDDRAAQAGRTDPHPDTFHVYHSGDKICVKRIDADSHWGVDLVLYCRRGTWSSPDWQSARIRTLEDDFDAAMPAPRHQSLPLLPAVVALALLFGGFAYKMYRQSRRTWWPLEIEERLACLMTGRSTWLEQAQGDEGAELVA